MLPILIDNDSTRQIGTVDNFNIATFDDDYEVTIETLYTVLGDIGFMPLEFRSINGVRFIKKIQILCYNRSTTSPPRPADFSQIRDMDLRNEYLEYLKGEIRAGRISLD